MEWRRRWTIHYRWEPGHDGIRSRGAGTPGELREALEWGRRQPHVWKTTHDSRNVLVGDDPTCCTNGHSYSGGSATRARQDWIGCTCGGHLIFICRWPDCGDRRTEPPITVDCQPTRPRPDH